MSPPCRPSFRAKPSSRPSSSPSLFRVLHIKQEDSFPLSHTRTLSLSSNVDATVSTSSFSFFCPDLIVVAQLAPRPLQLLLARSRARRDSMAFPPSFLPSFVIERPLTFSPEKSKGEAIGRSVGRLAEDEEEAREVGNLRQTAVIASRAMPALYFCGFCRRCHLHNGPRLLVPNAMHF